jgi:flagellar protein FlgJ
MIEGSIPAHTDVLQKYDAVQNGVRIKRAAKLLGKRAGFSEILQAQIEGEENRESKKLLDVCYEMESLFIGNMLKAMRKTVDESALYGKSFASQIFNDMLYDEYANIMARSDQFGIARQIYKQLDQTNPLR